MAIDEARAASALPHPLTTLARLMPGLPETPAQGMITMKFRKDRRSVAIDYLDPDQPPFPRVAEADTLLIDPCFHWHQDIIGAFSIIPPRYIHIGPFPEGVPLPLPPGASLTPTHGPATFGDLVQVEQALWRFALMCRRAPRTLRWSLSGAALLFSGYSLPSCEPPIEEECLIRLKFWAVMAGSRLTFETTLHDGSAEGEQRAHRVLIAYGRKLEALAAA